MIKKLRNKLNLETTSTSRSSSFLAPILIILLYLGGFSNLHGQSFTDATEALMYDFNACASFAHDESFKDYSEFTPISGNSCAAISGGQIYRVTGNHSCTSDEHGIAGDAACFQSSTDSHYTADHELAIRFDIEVSGSKDKASRLDGISFKQLAPLQYLWNNTGITGSTGPNNYPTKFGIRVSKDGTEIMMISDLATTQSWYTSEFNFNHNEHFVVAADTTSTFTFELYSYAPVGNGASVSAWDLDDLKIFSSCEERCNLTVDAGEDQSACKEGEFVLTANASNESVCTEIISSYKITDSNTEAGCFTADPGVIFQKGDGCQGIDYVWSAGDDLILNEYADNTATITGSVIDQNGRVATVNMELSDKENSGTTWNASCYLDGISGPETYYRSFIGAITVDGVAQSVGTRFNAHYILANGAGFDSSQYGLGAWTGGAFGECTEWFGNLVPMQIENPTQEIEYLWSTGETTQSITVTEAGEYTVTVSDCKGCTETDAVAIEIIRPKAYELTGGDTFCIDGEADFLTDNTIQVSGNIMGANSTFVVTDLDGKILGLPGTLEAVKGINFDSAGAGTCLIWHLAFEDGLQGAAMDANANDLEGCFSLSNPIKVERYEGPTANAGDDVTVCAGEEVMLTATGGGTYLWSTGETTASIKVTPTAKTTYSVTVTSDGGCEATDEVMVNVDDKVIIGDYVWLDDNRNGLQDDGLTGMNDIKVTLFQCDGEEVASTMTANNSEGEPGAYNFEVCPNSGEYYVVFGDIPDGLEFTSSNTGTNGAVDSDANADGRTDCFEVTDEDDLSIDGGLIELCDIKIDAGDDVDICDNEVIEITADIIDNTADCPGVCVYPIKDQERCYGPTGNFEIYLVSNGGLENYKFKASEQNFERYADNTARYTATASNGKDVIKVDALYTGYSTVAPLNSPKSNRCQSYDTSDWEYWTTWSGTITSENHGVFNLSVKEAAFQMGDGADMMRTGFGASGWFYVDGGDGFYSEGDVNVTLDPCVENSVSFKWTTEDGAIVGDANQKTIKVSEPGTYIVEAVNCIDCYTTDTIVVSRGSCNIGAKKAVTPQMSTVFPVPVQSGGTLTVEFDISNAANENSDVNVVSLQATVDFPDRQEDVTMLLYDMTGRVINIPRTFKIVNGKALIYLDLDYIPSGKYILRAQGPNWSDAKNVLVE
ncbi:SdrD B-like domain-containing protein [Maribacter sp. 2308TA10-17]|uniref:SdrD B-like domain-containing protein n=1 Tax=Maribacter sp. 2308TA10-17 TaxID=3386276 RepID=UPI0039BC5C30